MAIEGSLCQSRLPLLREDPRPARNLTRLSRCRHLLDPPSRAGRKGARRFGIRCGWARYAHPGDSHVAARGSPAGCCSDRVEPPDSFALTPPCAPCWKMWRWILADRDSPPDVGGRPALPRRQPIPSHWTCPHWPISRVSERVRAGDLSLSWTGRLPLLQGGPASCGQKCGGGFWRRGS